MMKIPEMLTGLSVKTKTGNQAEQQQGV